MNALSDEGIRVDESQSFMNLIVLHFKKYADLQDHGSWTMPEAAKAIVEENLEGRISQATILDYLRQGYATKVNEPSVEILCEALG